MEDNSWRLIRSNGACGLMSVDGSVLVFCTACFLHVCCLFFSATANNSNGTKMSWNNTTRASKTVCIAELVVCKVGAVGAVGAVDVVDVVDAVDVCFFFSSFCSL